jgi:hypothetical protein
LDFPKKFCLETDCLEVVRLQAGRVGALDDHGFRSLMLIEIVIG